MPPDSADSQSTISQNGFSSIAPHPKRNPATCWLRGLYAGGPKGIRTLDLCIANAALSQLSYRPLFFEAGSPGIIQSPGSGDNRASLGQVARLTPSASRLLDGPGNLVLLVITSGLAPLI